VPNVIVLALRFRIVRPKERHERSPDKAEIRRILSLAWPMSAQLVVRIAGMLLVVSLVARFFTTPEDQSASTAMGLVFRVDTIALFVAMGWGSAAQAFVGLSLGADKADRAVKSGWITAAYDAATNLLLIALLFTNAYAILRVFGGDESTLGLAVEYLKTVAPSYLFLGVAVVLGNAMAGAGATRTTLLLDLGSILAFQFPASLVLLMAFDAPIAALFRCVAVTNLVGALAYAFTYGRGSWKAAAARVTALPPAA
jgi:Na+-driven multidrug efflux pump